MLSAPWCDIDRTPEARLPRLLADGLANRGHEVHLLASGRGRPPARLPTMVADPVNPRVHYIDTGSGRGARIPHPGRHHRARWQRSALATVMQLEGGGRADVVHHLGPLPLHELGAIRPRAGLVTIVGPIRGGETAPPAFRRYFDGAWRLEAARGYGVRHLGSRLPAVRRTLSSVDAVLCANTETADVARTLGAERVDVQVPFVLPDGLPVVESILAEPDALLRVLWLGPPLPRRGLALAMEMVSEVDIRVRLGMRVVGGIPSSDRIETLFRRPGMYERVEAVNPMGINDQAKLMADSDVLLLTALRETDGFDAARAMQAGLPIVTLDHQVGAQLLADGGGIRLPVTTPVEAVRNGARALTELYRDRAHGEKLSAAAQTQAVRFSLSATVDRMEALYIDLTT